MFVTRGASGRLPDEPPPDTAVIRAYAACGMES